MRQHSIDIETILPIARFQFLIDNMQLMRTSNYYPQTGAHMRAVLQRVKEAKVEVNGVCVGAIELGWLVFLGVGRGDSEADVDYMVDRIVKLRGFADSQGKMNESVAQVNGSVLLVSQFTLFADCSSRRPGFKQAAEPDIAEELYKLACQRIAACGISVATGVFAADMKVSLLNDGPVTFLLDSRTE